MATSHGELQCTIWLHLGAPQVIVFGDRNQPKCNILKFSSFEIG